MQDAAYGTLLRGRRQRLHARIGATLEDRFPEIVVSQPALLGHHYAEAGHVERSIDYFLRAAHQAIARSELLEAEAQLDRGLDLVARIPEGIERQRRELDLQSARVVTLMQTRGYAAPTVAETIGRARQLCEQLDQPPQFATVLYVQGGYRILRGELSLACQNAMEQFRLGDVRNEPGVKATACMNAASAWFYRGEFVVARAHAERTIDLHDPAHAAAIAMMSPQDPHPVALVILSNALSCLGLLDQALFRCDEALVTARQRAHAFTLAAVLAIACDRDAVVRSDPARLLARAENLQAFCAEHGFPYWAAMASSFRGFALSLLGQTDQGLALATKGLADYRATGALLYVPRFLVLLAECHRKAGEPILGLKCLDEASLLIGETQIASAAAEMSRRRGEFLLVVGDRAAAEASFLQAIDVARRQNAKLLELQAVCKLARLWRDRGKRADARDLLNPIYNWFTEGFDAPDLKDARALLDDLA